jgi:hypothetical protein
MDDYGEVFVVLKGRVMLSLLLRIGMLTTFSNGSISGVSSISLLRYTHAAELVTFEVV